MKRYSIIHVPVLSFFSKALYRDVCLQWKGTGFAYLLLLLAVCWIAPIIKIHQDFSVFVDTEATQIISQIPTISIVNGKASVAEPQPHRITNPKTGETLVVIDTTGGIATLEDAEAIGLVTETHAIFKKSQVETRSFSFADVKQFTLGQDMITRWLAVTKRIMAPVLYPFAVLGSFLGRVIQVLLYAAIGMLFASWCKSRRTYVELLRLSIVAVTPVIIIKTLLGIGHVSIPFAGLWYFLGAMGYLFFGVKAASQDESPASADTLSNFPREG
jgi:hypothetical protein